MSGGAWGYLEWKLKDREVPAFWLDVILPALGEVEHLMDWAVCGDTLRAEAEPEVWNVLERMFDALTKRA